MHKLKILCTGSCGFLMGNFIRRAIYEKHPYSFVSIDRVNNNAINSMYWNKNHIFHVADIKDQHIIDVIFKFERPDIVIHGASDSSDDTTSLLSSNIVGTQTLINSCLKYDVKRFIFLSTNKVLGSLQSPSDAPFLEDSPLRPENMYAASKASAETLVKISGLIYNIVRQSNSYGPRQRVNRLIPTTIKSILNDKPITVFGQGQQLRDWVHIYDVSTAIMSVIDNGKPNEIYNIGANQEFSNIEVIQKICNIMGKGHNLINHIEDPRKNDFRYISNFNKIRELGWSPETKFKDGLAQHIEWSKSNTWFYK